MNSLNFINSIQKEIDAISNYDTAFKPDDNDSSVENFEKPKSFLKVVKDDEQESFIKTRKELMILMKKLKVKNVKLGFVS